jgi:hypothetical protein
MIRRISSFSQLRIAHCKQPNLNPLVFSSRQNTA